MEPTKHKLRTLEDILGVVDEGNLDDFLQDFGGWLRFTLTVGTIKDTFEDIARVEQPERGTMTWIEDGKHDANITIQATTE